MSKRELSPIESSWFDGDWKLADGWILDSMMVFEKLNSEESENFQGDLFTIKRKSLAYQYKTDMGICGNGMFFLDSADFMMFDKNMASLNLYGGRMVESSLTYKADYDCEILNDNSFRLDLKKIKLNEVKSIYD